MNKITIAEPYANVVLMKNLLDYMNSSVKISYWDQDTMRRDLGRLSVHQLLDRHSVAYGGACMDLTGIASDYLMNELQFEHSVFVEQYRAPREHPAPIHFYIQGKDGTVFDFATRNLVYCYTGPYSNVQRLTTVNNFEHKGIVDPDIPLIELFEPITNQIPNFNLGKAVERIIEGKSPEEFRRYLAELANGGQFYWNSHSRLNKQPMLLFAS